ncbi:transporter [Fructobacillus papyrifericola]|uniref:Transporter n=1 Tax=Fructobacillus papyrifericola TaxID=2713172 RepID=A0ABS5QTD7_9LACO|nr:transporter [Fructobacillus papyrifericola]MBS9336386.1 transporter [Fructobacillus papyrifericola]
MKLKVNILAGIYSIFAAVMFCISWFVVIAEAVNSNGQSSNSITFFYAVAWIGVVLNAYALYASKKAGISLVGAVLGLVGTLLFGFTAGLAFPAIVVLIIAAVFQFLQRPAKKQVQN